MEIVNIPRPKGPVLSYNEAHDFTRRIPTFLTEKQKIRDAKIIAQIIRAGDVENDKDKVFRIFLNHRRLLSDPRYWEVLRTVWVLCGSVDNLKLFKALFNSNRRAKSWFMTPEDSKYLESLQFPVTLYRAYTTDEDNGISWTDDKEWCEEYARNFGRKIKTKTFERKDIYAYISRRGENEYLILD